MKVQLCGSYLQWCTVHSVQVHKMVHQGAAPQQVFASDDNTRPILLHCFNYVMIDVIDHSKLRLPEYLSMPWGCVNISIEQVWCLYIVCVVDLRVVSNTGVQPSRDT